MKPKRKYKSKPHVNRPTMTQHTFNQLMGLRRKLVKQEAQNGKSQTQGKLP